MAWRTKVCAGRVKEGARRMSGVMITSTGVYLILALAILVIISGGVFVAYRVNNRRDQ